MINNNIGIKYDDEYFKTVSWRFVTRRFARIYIREEGFFYCGQEKRNGRVILWEVNHVTNLVIDGEANLIEGLPKPKPAGGRNIYCDSLFLCPDCGRFYFRNDDKFTFTKYFGFPFGFGTIREQSIVSLYEEKKNNNEFEILECKTKICLATKDKNLKLKLSSVDKDTRMEGLTDAIESYYDDEISNVSDNGYNGREGFIYIIKAEKHVKIGIADDIKNRLRQIQSTCPIKLEIINFWKISNVYYYENLLHKRYKQYRVHGEWFVLPEKDINFLSMVGDIKEAMKNK